MTTNKGNEIYRSTSGNGFIVQQEIIMFDQDANECYRTVIDHASLYIPIGMSKADAWRMISGWLEYYDDDELTARAWDELCDLFQPAPARLPVAMREDDKDMN